MTLKEKFYKELISRPDLYPLEECEQVADEFAIEFAEWLGKFGNIRLTNGNWMINMGLKILTTKELLEIYKKEKAL